MSYLLSRYNSWKIGYNGLGILLLILFVLFIFVRLPISTRSLRSKLPYNLKALIVNKNFILLVILNGLAVGTQFALMFLSVTYLKEAKGLSIYYASFFLSGFFVALVAGRLICSLLSLHIINAKILLFLLCFQLAMVFLVWKTIGWMSGIALVASGLACSGIFPCLLALTGTLFFEVAGTALGILGTASGLGGMIICALTGVLFQKASVQLGYIVIVLSSLSALVLFLINYRKLSIEERQRGGNQY
jgi:fucose permease